jgi:hypothetical protein
LSSRMTPGMIVWRCGRWMIGGSWDIAALTHATARMMATIFFMIRGIDEGLALGFTGSGGAGMMKVMEVTEVMEVRALLAAVILELTEERGK